MMMTFLYDKEVNVTLDRIEGKILNVQSQTDEKNRKQLEISLSQDGSDNRFATLREKDI